VDGWASFRIKVKFKTITVKGLLLFCTVVISVSCALERSLKTVQFQGFRTWVSKYRGQDAVDYSAIKLKRVNKTRLFFGKIIHHVALEDSYSVSATIEKKQGGEYRLMMYKFKLTAVCSFFQKDENVYPEIAKSSDYEYPMKCPIKAVKIWAAANLQDSFGNFHCKNILCFIIISTFSSEPTIFMGSVPFCKASNILWWLGGYAVTRGVGHSMGVN
jgi:hypothetical protein